MPMFILDMPDSNIPDPFDPHEPGPESEKDKTTSHGGQGGSPGSEKKEEGKPESMSSTEGRPVGRESAPARVGARGTAAMDPDTRKEVARKGGIAVSRNREHMAQIGRKGGQSVSKNREHMASIGRKGGAASRGHRG